MGMEAETGQDNRHRGRLKIFFSYTSGAGKTYAMLQAAQEAKKQGVDVVAGYVEPHSHPQTLNLLRGIEVLSPLVLEYQGIRVNEFDLDGAIARKPQLLLVDQLAHTNAASCRHVKRYRDIGELLQAGIDVYTTVNVQNIESLNDMVASAAGEMVQERIPDKVFDEADQVELVDIEPEELVRRLKESLAAGSKNGTEPENPLSIENLTVLRELALRRCADRVNRVADKTRQAARSEYYREEHVLICLSSSPSNSKIIRTAARLSGAFKGRLTALFVETPGFENLSETDKQRLRDNVHLAEQLGARIETVYGEDVAFQIAEYARISGASKIVIGRSNTRRRFAFSRQTFAERLTEFAPNLDIYIIPDKDAELEKRRLAKIDGEQLRLVDFWKSLGVMAVATAIGLGFEYAGFSEANIITIYILAVLMIAVTTSGRVYSLASSVVSVVVFNFFFTVPKYSLTAYDSGYPVTFLIMFLAALLTSSLAVKIKRQAVHSARIAYRTQVLLETSQMLSKEKSTEGIANVASRQLVKLLHTLILFYPADEEGLNNPLESGTEDPLSVELYTDGKERAVAEWVYRNNRHAGATTDTFGSARCLYLALRGTEGVYGVVGIEVGREGIEAFENSLILSILGECGIAMEKELYARKRAEAAAKARNEQLRANLLRSISHDLRTPLTSILGNAGVLRTSSDRLDERKKQQLYTDIYDDSMWLINLVENLLAVTRIEEGSMNLHLQAELVEEVVDEALRHLNRRSEDYHIEVRRDEEFLLAKMDARLIVQVLINLIDNAIKYTRPGSHIWIRFSREKELAVIEIADDGDGIPDESKERIFEMFYTANNGTGDSRRSLGLGLALCKSIVNAHGGSISVRDNAPHGTVFSFTLMAEEANLHE